jgi:hypothetical protein
MNYSRVDIANSALTTLRSEGVTSLSEDSYESRTVNTKLDMAIDTLLGEADWISATRTEVLVQVAETSPYPDALPYMYALPSDMIRLLSVIVDGDPFTISDSYYGDAYTPSSQAYLVEGSTLYSPSETCTIRYIKRIAPAEMSSYMIEPLVTLLAAELAYPIANSANYGDLLRKKYRKEMAEAAFKNGLEMSNTLKSGQSMTGRVL